MIPAHDKRILSGIPRRCAVALCLLLTVLACGCVRRGEHLAVGEMGAPVSVDEVLAGLTQTQNAMRQFEARGVFIFRSSASAADFAGRGFVRYASPASLALDARHRASGTLALRLRAQGGDAYMLYGAPGERQEALWENGRRTYGQPMPVSPFAIARELFFPEDWAAAAKAASFSDEEEDGLVALAIEGEDYRREILVTGPPWALIRNRLYKDGKLLAETAYEDYRVYGEVPFPMELRGAFFGEPAASIEVRLTTAPAINEPLPENSFAIMGLEYDSES